MQSIYRFLITLALVVPITTHATVWNIDANHSNVGFKIKHLMVSNVKGSFQKLSGLIETDDKDNTKTHVSVTIDIGSINTNQVQRDEHLKSPDFFDVAKYPTMTYVSRKIVKSSKGYTVIGDLTLHGVTKEVILKSDGPSKEINDGWGNIRRGISAFAKISRKDFGLTYNAVLEAGGVVIGDDVEISLEIEGIKTK